MVFGDLSPEFYPDKLPLFVAELRDDSDDSIFFLRNVEQAARNSIFQKLKHTPSLELRYFNALELKDPKPAPLDNGDQEEMRRLHGYTRQA
jgi:hypothetical protein